ncbi:hypothetical protein E2C01_065759 [Portunus trituberculatus]|uniref:Uncharacterized protein n=1 Tax=Portunus trituberculatus TaxID=210409 RepID=A0A5B7HFF8_PORTR|nr:hypothetical protein [Portunus trituberculatus]
MPYFPKAGKGVEALREEEERKEGLGRVGRAGERGVCNIGRWMASFPPLRSRAPGFTIHLFLQVEDKIPLRAHDNASHRKKGLGSPLSRGVFGVRAGYTGLSGGPGQYRSWDWRHKGQAGSVRRFVLGLWAAVSAVGVHGPFPRPPRAPQSSGVGRAVREGGRKR